MSRKHSFVAFTIVLCMLLTAGSALAAGCGYGNLSPYCYVSNGNYAYGSSGNTCPQNAGNVNRNCPGNTTCKNGSACCSASGCDRCSVCLASTCAICPGKACNSNGSVINTGSGSSAGNGNPSPSVPTTDGHYTIGSVSAQESQAWNYVNIERQRQGLPALVLDEKLCALARMKSEDMLTNRYFAHTSPTYGSAKQMLTTYGYRFTGVGENIARHATVAKAHAAFMSSAGHRANILGQAWTKVGIGIALDENGFVYMTQLFVR